MTIELRIQYINAPTEAVTPPVIAMFLLCLPVPWYLLCIFLPTHTGIPMIIAGMEMPAIKAIPTGAPTRVPSYEHKSVDGLIS